MSKAVIVKQTDKGGQWQAHVHGTQVIGQGKSIDQAVDDAVREARRRGIMTDREDYSVQKR